MTTSHMTTHQHLRVHKTKTHIGWAVVDGITGGVVAGLIFALVQMLTFWLLTGNGFYPLQMMASILFQDIPATISVGNAIIFGGLLHFTISATLGVITTLMIISSKSLYKTRERIVWFAAFVGFLAWVINSYIIAPLIGTPWFVTQTNPFFQFLWHTFAFGAILGWFIDATPPRDHIRIRE